MLGYSKITCFFPNENVLYRENYSTILHYVFLGSMLNVKFVFLSLIVGACDAGKSGFGPGLQNWGHITVRDGAHMFYWLYYTTANVASYLERPLVIWLEGGPGESSTGFSNFLELGPLDLNLKTRNLSWVYNFNVLLIDNPVGTGFSYVESDEYFARNNLQIANDLVSFMKKFYKLHPEFKRVPLHIFTESYGGKMAAEFALELYKAIKNNEIVCTLKSVALGNPWISPIDSMSSRGTLLLEMGLVDHRGHDEIVAIAQKAQKALDEGQYVNATEMARESIRLILNLTNGVNFYDITAKIKFNETKQEGQSLEMEMIDAEDKESLDFQLKLLTDLMRGPVSQALNISNSVLYGSQSNQVSQMLEGDIVKPVLHIVETLLNTTDIQVVAYSGNLDLSCPTPGTVNWIKKMKWISKDKYDSAPRNAFGVNGILEGYVKTYDKFSMYWIRRAGHIVQQQNPIAMDYVLQKVTNYV